VGNYRKTFTLPRRLSRVAFAIRIYSRHSCVSEVNQSIASQAETSEETPSGDVVVLATYLSSCWWFRTLTRDERPLERLTLTGYWQRRPKDMIQVNSKVALDVMLSP